MLITVYFVGAYPGCPEKNVTHALRMGMKCKKSCIDDVECKAKSKKCRCDDFCGRSCLNPGKLYQFSVTYNLPSGFPVSIWSNCMLYQALHGSVYYICDLEDWSLIKLKKGLFANTYVQIRGYLHIPYAQVGGYLHHWGSHARFANCTKIKTMITGLPRPVLLVVLYLYMRHMTTNIMIKYFQI